MTVYIVCARRRTFYGRIETYTDIPTFLLPADTLGIVDDAHAIRIAREILGNGIPFAGSIFVQKETF